MILRKKPEASLKLKYPLILRVSLVLSLIFLITFMLAFPKFRREAKQIEQKQSFIKQDESVVTEQQIQSAAPPSKATIPVESEDEDLANEDFDFDMQDFENYQADEWSAPPPPPEEENDNSRRRRFIAYDEAPQPIGGFKAIQQNIIYPEIAREAGIEGKVVIRAFIDKNGDVQECEVDQGIPNTGLNEAAINAIKRTKFKPAMQRDRKVGVWISIPVFFRLNK
ncbi:MAG: energy transducer TonB [Candidatus Marinimicrobia bacterium]|nr:energy transducer TonB [Candidatus Neomarinimicrobiota bacterium]